MNVPQSITTSSGGRSDSVVTATTGGVGEAITSVGSLSLLNSYTSIASSSSINSSASSLASASTTGTAMTVSASTSALQNSSKYRAYAQAVDKALKSFENTTEWADLIAALGKLGKVLASNAKLFSDIPSSVTVAKRLSQCLHPALPSGVHLKALETYRQVFSILGRGGNLPRYLYLFAIGLFPLMDHCGIKVKSELLGIFEQYLLPLNADGLRPALPGFITAVLFGLEEGTEFYARSFSLLEQVMARVGTDSFYSSFWQAVLGNSAVRLPALMFLNAKLEKSKEPSAHDQRLSLVAGEVGTNYMVSALCAVADDPGSTLIQRHLLDFLCQNLPLDSRYVRHQDLVDILQRVLFVVLRRDISLNRRLYQWLLNRSTDVCGFSVAQTGTANGSGTPEEQLDLKFFTNHTLPLIKLAIHQFLKLDTVEILQSVPSSSITATAGANHTLSRRDSHQQMQYTEVRVCRFLHYLIDGKPELGMPVLNETLPLVLEFAAKQDLHLIEELQRQCEEIDPSFGSLAAEGMGDDESVEQGSQRGKRIDEARKNLNSLLNPLDQPGFLWQFLEQFFAGLHQQGSPPDSAADSPRRMLSRSDTTFYMHKEHVVLFPLIVAYAVKTVQLDSHSEIRGRHLTSLLKTMLDVVRERGCDCFYRDNLVALLVVARRLLSEINQSVAIFEAIQAINGQPLDQSSPSKTEAMHTKYKSECAEGKCQGSPRPCLAVGFRRNSPVPSEQRLVESCLQACFHLLSEICSWYTTRGRDRDKMGVLCAVSSLIRDFADFPFYYFESTSTRSTTTGADMPCFAISDTLKESEHYHNSSSYYGNHPVWLADLIGVVDADDWVESSHRAGNDCTDFEMRARVLDLILYLYIRSSSVLEQHAALMTRQAGIYHGGNDHSSSSRVTTVLLKPFMSSMDLDRLERDTLFRKSATVLWEKMGGSCASEAGTIQSVALLLLQLHSRRSTEVSSDVEEIIVSELISLDKCTSGTAAKKFRDLWTVRRSVSEANIFRSGVPLKPMNKTVMVMLGFIADDAVGTERIEMRAAAHAWLLDCSRHNDLHKILQMLFQMLLNPATARVSVHYVQVESRVTKAEQSSMPVEANVVTLRTIKNSQQTYHHVCRDIDVPLRTAETQKPSATSSWTNFSYIDCSSQQPWVRELNKQLLLPSASYFGSLTAGSAATGDGFSTSAPSSSANLVNPFTGVTTAVAVSPQAYPTTVSPIEVTDSREVQGASGARLSTTTASSGGPGHRRTMSDIPQFDEEEDADSVGSLSLDSSLDHDVLEALQFIIDSVADADGTVESRTLVGSDARGGAVGEVEETSFSSRSTLEATPTNAIDDNNANRGIKPPPEGDEVSIVGPLQCPPTTRPGTLMNGDVASALTNSGGTGTIRRIKCGHRRQDSLQESIFNTTTQELRFFDPSELPTTTHPGDGKQPLMDEPSAHMLLYTESPGVVDLGRAEKVFRTISALLRSSGHSLGKHIVNLLFTNASHLKAHNSGVHAGAGSQLSEMMINHLKEILGYGFWASDEAVKDNQTIVRERSRNPTLFEIFSTIAIFYFRSFFLNSPTNYVSPDDLVLAWKCKIAALDCFAEMIRVLNDTVREMNSREYAIFAQQIYQCTKAQKAIIHLLLTAVPAPPASLSDGKAWRMPLTVDIIEFNNGPAWNYRFGDLISAYQRSLLELALAIVGLEYNLHMGIRNCPAQGLSIHFDKLMEQTQRYNSPANRATLRGNLMVEIRMFISVILNALKRCPERHELWLQFLIASIPYLDRALPTFAVHVVEQICRNIYESIGSGGGGLSQSPLLSAAALGLMQQRSASSPTPYGGAIGERKAPYYFVDFRIPRKDQPSTPMVAGKYPANYTLSLMEALMSLLHYCMVEPAYATMPLVFARSGSNRSSFVLPTPGGGNLQPPSLPSSTPLSTGSGGGGGGSSMSLNMTSMMGSAMSVIPGTTLINNLIGKVFTTGDSSNHHKADSSIDPSVALAQKELIKLLPSTLAILADVWCASELTISKQCGGMAVNAGSVEFVRQLVLDTLNPLARKHLSSLVSSFGTVWTARGMSPLDVEAGYGYRSEGSSQKPSFNYSSQQQSIARLVLALKLLPLKSLISSVAETLREVAATAGGKQSGKPPPSPSHGDRPDHCVEIALLELLHECVRRVTVGELRDSWETLSVLLMESPLGALPARSAFLEFSILVEFVHRCGAQSIVEDKLISRSIIDVCHRLTDAVNMVVGWQLESTTWLNLRRTLVVKQDAGVSQKASALDISPTVELRTGAPTATGSIYSSSEVNSIRGSTISLSGGGGTISILSSAASASGNSTARMSSLAAGDGLSQISSTQPATITGSVAQLSQSSDGAATAKKSVATLRSSTNKDHPATTNRKDPTESTQALFLLAEDLTELVDSITRSEDKDKLVQTMNGVWMNTLPYLRAKNAKNVRFFLAGSQFLASMSSFNYMRVVWKRSTMELLMDPAFFKMDIHALKHWLVTIDNLMSNDKVSFKELLAKMTTSTAATFSNLITSKEQEYDMRAQALKRLAFVILSSEIDQYGQYLSDIHERLSDSLRLSQAPVVCVQVFACYRVLLIRMRPISFVTMWPTVVTELVQVLSQIEQQLSGPNANVLEDLKCSRDDHWMQLYLAACKLLETLCTLPSGYVAQFQMCRWAFGAFAPSSTLPTASSRPAAGHVFVPFALRINHLMDVKYGEIGARERERHSASLFNVKTLTSFQELHPFFHSLANQHQNSFNEGSVESASMMGDSRSCDYGGPTMNGNVRRQAQQGSVDRPAPVGDELRDAHLLTGMLSLKAAVARIEHSLYVDFADHWQL